MGGGAITPWPPLPTCGEGVYGARGPVMSRKAVPDSSRMAVGLATFFPPGFDILAEAALWKALRGRRLGGPEVPAAPHAVDGFSVLRFYCA